MKPLVIIADDLSGAAESAAGFLLRSSGISLGSAQMRPTDQE